MTAKNRILEKLKAGFNGSLDELCDVVGSQKQTVKKHLNDLLREGDDRALKIGGFIPDASWLVDIAEKEIGPLNSSNLMEANLATKSRIDEFSKPELRRVFVDGIPGKINDGELTVQLEALFQYVADDFLPHVTETGNGFVSIVGRLNEEIILRALRNSELKEGVDYQRTGNNSVGDIIVSQRGGQRDNLYVEVKSYHARERLLRGLQDIDRPIKVGIGYFRDPREFNSKRTQTLIDTGARAIYLPADTFAMVDVGARKMKTGQQDLFYRPFSMFVDDMVSFATNGQIRRFRDN